MKYEGTDVIYGLTGQEFEVMREAMLRLGALSNMAANLSGSLEFQQGELWALFSDPWEALRYVVDAAQERLQAESPGNGKAGAKRRIVKMKSA
jgi:hypothetical protein